MGELKAERDDADLLGGRHPERDEILFHRLRNRDQGVGDRREPRLEPAEELRLGGREIAAQHVAVISVNHDRHTGGAGRETPEETRLRGVGVNDGRAPSAHQARQAHERAEVLERCDLTPETGEPFAFDALLRGQVKHVPLSRRLPSHHETRGVAEGSQPGAQEDHVEGGTSDVQAREDAQHPDVFRTSAV